VIEMFMRARLLAGLVNSLPEATDKRGALFPRLIVSVPLWLGLGPARRGGRL